VTRSETVVLRSASSLKKRGGKPPPPVAPAFSAFSDYIPFQSAERHFRILSRQRAVGLFVLGVRLECVSASASASGNTSESEELNREEHAATRRTGSGLRASAPVIK
jgi:hypothetical protein